MTCVSVQPTLQFYTLFLFCSPVIIEVPHFASLRGKEREIAIIRCDDGEKWTEHPILATEEAVNDTLNGSFEGQNSSASSLWSEPAILFCFFSLGFIFNFFKSSAILSNLKFE